jgi:hypothetical protein
LGFDSRQEHSVQTGSEARIASCPVRTGEYFPGDKAAMKLYFHYPIRLGVMFNYLSTGMLYFTLPVNVVYLELSNCNAYT